MHRLIATIAALLLAATSVHGTAVISMRTANAIILAADSAVRATDGRTTRTCKIRPAGRRFWFLLGGWQSADELDLFAVFADAIRPARSVRDALIKVQDVWTRDLQPLVSRRPPGSVPLLELSIAGRDPDGMLRLAIFSAQLDANTWGSRVFPGSPCTEAWCAGDRILRGASFLEGGPLLRALHASPRPAWLDQLNAGAALRLIREDIAADTGRAILPPVDILEIDGSGAHWRYRDPHSLCAAK